MFIDTMPTARECLAMIESNRQAALFAERRLEAARMGITQLDPGEGERLGRAIAEAAWNLRFWRAKLEAAEAADAE